MPRESPFVVVLTDAEERCLQETARKYTSPYCEVIRAKVVLLAADGLENTEIAARLDGPRQIVSKWRKRFCQKRLGGLESRPRRGRPNLVPPEVVGEVKALACERPSEAGLPFSRFSCTDRAREAVRRGIATSISGRTVWRWLLDFQGYDETMARPLAWKFTRADLDDLRVRLGQHEQNQHKAVA